MFKRRLAIALLLVLSAGSRAVADACPSVSFTLKQTLSGHPSNMHTLQAIDYDHDGVLDLVGTVTEGYWDEAYTWHGVGDGTFEPAVPLGNSYVTGLQVIDVNADGYEDIVGADFTYRIWVRLGTANGLGSPISTSTDYYPQHLQAGDFHEGSSGVDLVATSHSNGTFSVLQGNGDGTFTETRRVDLGVQYSAFDQAVADFDSDGRFDVAISHRTGQKVDLYFRNADGTFAPPMSLPTRWWTTKLATGDLDEDGLPDLAVTKWEDGTVDVFLNRGNRTFSTPQTLLVNVPGTHGNASAIQLVDVNADSHLDLLASTVNGGGIAVFVGDGTGAFASPTWLDNVLHPFAFAIGNFDTDADLELAAGDWQKLHIADSSCATQRRLYSISPMTTSGYPAKFRVAVSGISAHTPLPRGTVTFKEGATTLGTSEVDAHGTAALDYTDLSVGNHTIVAELSANIGGGATQSIVQKVISGKSSITLALGPSVHGEPFGSAVTIKNQNGETWPDYPTWPGYYLLTIDGVTEETPRWNEGLPLTLTLTLSAGTHTIWAEYLGENWVPASLSTAYLITTAKHAVSLAKAGDSVMREGTPHPIQINVSATTSPVPTGTVTLYREGTQVGSGALNNGVFLFNGTLPRGSYQYTAAYSGDANYLTGNVTFALDVLPNSAVAIDARSVDSSVFIPALVPNGTTQTTMYRRVHGTSSWSVVPSWTLLSQTDDGSGMTRGVVYDYRLDATVSGQVQQSNIDSALLYTDPALTAGITNIKLAHLYELRDAINALRASAGLPPFAFDGTIGLGFFVRASHVDGLRNAVNEARSSLGMAAATFTDSTLATGTTIRRAHVTELREAAQ